MLLSRRGCRTGGCTRIKAISGKSGAPGLAFAGLVVANVALAFGPLFVRLADVGPVAVGFWRIALAAPVLVALALARRWRPSAVARGVWVAVAIGGLCFAADLAKKLVAEGHRADVIHANNVMAHVPDIRGVLEGVLTFLKDDGVTDVVLVSSAAHAKRIGEIAGEVGMHAHVSPAGHHASAKELARETVAVAVGRVIGFRRLDRIDH